MTKQYKSVCNICGAEIIIKETKGGKRRNYCPWCKKFKHASGRGPQEVSRVSVEVGINDKFAVLVRKNPFYEDWVSDIFFYGSMHCSRNKIVKLPDWIKADDYLWHRYEVGDILDGGENILHKEGEEQ